MQTTAWVIGAIALASIAIVFARSWLRHDSLDDLGTVSHQWIAEQRMGPRDR